MADVTPYNLYTGVPHLSRGDGRLLASILHKTIKGKRFFLII